MTTRKSSAWLALLIAFLMAMPPVALADDTELFTTSANPNVLLMLDTTGSMDTQAAGDRRSGISTEAAQRTRRMDILWKVVYTLLNADLSIPAASAYAGGQATSISYNANTTYTRHPGQRRKLDYLPVSHDGTIIRSGAAAMSDNVHLFEQVDHCSREVLPQFLSRDNLLRSTHSTDSTVSILGMALQVLRTRSTTRRPSARLS